MNLKETLQSLKLNQALLHYNIATLEQYKAGIKAVEETNIPLIIGVSEGERKYLGIENIKYLINEAQSRGLPVFLNADHCKSVESSNEAIDNLFNSILFDGSELTIDENILRTKEIKRRVENILKTQGVEILVEGEIGYIPGSSDIEGAIKLDKKNFTNPEDVEKFLQEIKVDLLAVSVGNIHGIPKQSLQIDFERIKSIYERTQQFKSFSGLVLHGGSGLTSEDFVKTIENGVKIIHINTEFRKIWKENLIENLKQETVVPYKIYNGVINKLKERIIYYQKLFANNTNIKPTNNTN